MSFNNLLQKSESVNSAIKSSSMAADGPDPDSPPNSGRPKKKGPAIDKQWADFILRDKALPWFAESSHTSGGVAVHRWNGSYLQFIGFEEGASIAANWLDKTAPDRANEATSNSIWKYGAKRLRSERIMPKQDMRRNIIPCGDVYLEMTKDCIKAIQPEPAYGMTYAIKLNAGTAVGEIHKLKGLEETSRFRTFLERALPDEEIRNLVQEQCGLTLLPANYQIASWWVGAAGSGKSTLVEMCKAMQRQVACISLDDLSTGFGIEGLIGASFVQVDEVEAEKWAEGKFKSLVSCNGVSINRKNEKALMDHRIRAKWCITSNDRPFVRDKSDGVWRRICIVPFNVVIPEEERVPDFHNVLLEEESQQILDWMLEGAMRLVKRGHFMPEHERPAAVRGIKEESRDGCDSVRAWSKIFSVQVRKGIKDSDTLRSKDDVYTEYEAWALAAHEDPISRRAFWKGLRAQIPGIANYNRRVNGSQVYFCNLEWTPPKPKLVVSNSEVSAKQDTLGKVKASRPKFEVAQSITNFADGSASSVNQDWNELLLEGVDPTVADKRVSSG